MIAVTDKTFEAEVLEHEGPVLVDFWASWCGPCRQLAPVLEALAKEHPELKIVKVDVDANPEATQGNGVTAMPTLHVYVDGSIQKTIIGAKPKGTLINELSEFLDTEEE